MGGLDVSAAMVQIAAHAYSDEHDHLEAESGFNLNEHYGAQTVEDAIDNLPFHGGNTWTGTAVEHTTTQVLCASCAGKRANVPTAMIIVTDGKPTGTVDASAHAAQAAKAARDAGIAVFAIGVGGTYDEQNLQDMASTPHANHIYRLDNFDVATFKEQLLTTICTDASGGSSTNSGSSSGKRYVNTYQVNYNCDDGIMYPSNDSRGKTPSPANQAQQKTRYVRVEDTTVPVVTLRGDSSIVNSAGFQTNSVDHGFEGMGGKSNSHDSIAHCNGLDCSGTQHTTGFIDWNKLSVGTSWIYWIQNIDAGHGGDDQTKWRGASCSDTCDVSPTLVATLHYGGDCTGELVECKTANCQRQKGDLRNFPEFRAATYSIKYTCTDGNEGDVRPGLTHSVCRKIENVDHTKPVIQILGSDRMTLEATHTGNYVDDGAVCYDQVDGVISQNVEVSGDVVNLSRVGTYEIVYNCKDSTGNTAPTETRTVVVVQTACPTCTVNGCPASTGTTTDDVPAVCVNQPIDIAFVLDSSGSIRSSRFTTMKQEVGKIVQGLDVSATMVQVAAHAYSNSNDHLKDESGFNLNEHYGAQTVMNEINDLPFHGRNTWTGTAIEHTVEQVLVASKGKRANVPTAMIIVTDGKPTGEASGKAKLEAEKARAAGIKVFAIGVGGTYNEQNLKDMASEPHSEHIYKLDNFDVADFKKKLLTTICTEASGGSSNNSGNGAYDCSFNHEASFEYTDAGAVCSDEIDGEVPYTTINPVDVETTGTYVVTYRAKNAVGLWNDGAGAVGGQCRGGNHQYMRTIHVVDTLKPLIEVHYKNNLVARGTATDKAVHNNAANPVAAATPAFMAEAWDASSAWLVGAAAAAIAGVALLSFSRRAETTTSVPV